MSWTINAKGGVFQNGASYPMKKRIQIILTYVNSSSIAATCRIEKIYYNSVSKLLTQFQQNAQFGARSFGNRRPNRIPIWMKVYIEALIIIYPLLYIRECVQMVAEHFNLRPNDVPTYSAVRSLLKKLHITRKKCIHVARERYSPYVLQRRQDYIRWRMTIDPARMYFFDETSFTTETDQREYGRTENGYRLASFRSKNQRAAKHSVLGLCGFNEGFIQAIPIEGNFNTILVNEVIESFGIKIKNVTYRDYKRLKYIQQNYGLLGNDAITLSIMIREKIKCIATFDKDFSKVDFVKNYFEK